MPKKPAPNATITITMRGKKLQASAQFSPAAATGGGLHPVAMAALRAMAVIAETPNPSKPKTKKT